MREEEQNSGSLLELLAQLRDREVPKEQYKGYMDRFLEVQARQKGIPFKGQFELTPLCNLDCRMCYVHLQKEQLKEKQLLSCGQWKWLMEQAIDCGMRRAVLTGGECLTYPGFEELYLFLLSRGVEVQVYTNGILLTEEKIRFFQKNMPARIQVSVYGSDEEGYEKVTGHRRYRQVMENIECAKERGLPIQAAVTPNACMGEDAKKILLDLDERKIPFQINNTFFDPREETGRQGKDMDISTEAYIRLFQLQASLAGARLSETEEKDLPDLPKNMGTEKGIRCAAGTSSFHINWRGKMSGCDMLAGSLEEPLKTGFLKAWEAVHQAALEYPVAVQCRHCAYEKACVSCPAIHQQLGQAPGHCSRNICERTRQFVKSGLVTL